MELVGLLHVNVPLQVINFVSEAEGPSERVVGDLEVEGVAVPCQGPEDTGPSLARNIPFVTLIFLISLSQDGNRVVFTGFVTLQGSGPLILRRPASLAAQSTLGQHISWTLVLLFEMPVQQI